MSYDVTVGTQEFSYTYNLGQFFRDFEVHPITDLAGNTPLEVRKKVGTALQNIAVYDTNYLRAEYDPPNGWGNVEGATRFLFEIYMACLTESDADTVEAT